MFRKAQKTESEFLFALSEIADREKHSLLCGAKIHAQPWHELEGHVYAEDSDQVHSTARLMVTHIELIVKEISQQIPNTLSIMVHAKAAYECYCKTFELQRKAA